MIYFQKKWNVYFNRSRFDGEVLELEPWQSGIGKWSLCMKQNPLRPHMFIKLRLITINERNKNLYVPKPVFWGDTYQNTLFFYWPFFDEWCAIWCWTTLRGWIDQIGHVMALFNISRMLNIPHPIWCIEHDKTNLWWLEISKAKGRIREMFFCRYCISKSPVRGCLISPWETSVNNCRRRPSSALGGEIISSFNLYNKYCFF